MDLQVWRHMCKYIKENDPDVYGCCCNVDKGKYIDSLAATLRLPAIRYDLRVYRWLKESQRKYLLNQGETVIPVKFNANLAFVKRVVKQQIKYMSLPYPTDERPVHERRGGYACDLAFCHSLEALDIVPLLDLRVKLEHLRYAGKLQVGIKPKEIKFLKYEGNDKA